ncbi:superoxide dismutase [Cu-Zn] [Biomphalaria glabrata]|uniref:Superoxide dismutase [Cu-Zn] n=2 Tax=Biomphalaria glabrata TaxID=6526 RepID=A0A2C9JB89_BIOGL|nr:superoxide dismutase Cu-Zn-like [Biomphalaria glabrata]
MMVCAFTCLLLSVVCLAVQVSAQQTGCKNKSITHAGYSQPPRNALCRLQPDPASTQKVSGIVIFNQTGPSEPLKMTIHLSGFKTYSPDTPETQLLHGFHIHEFGDVASGCLAAGGHYNPKNSNHGDITDRVRHVGDFGNIKQELDGTLEKVIEDKIATLYGTYSVLSRAVVVHEKPDDLGRGGNPASLLNGNAGARLACCSIVISP